jgi:hypothetical protein
VRRPRENGVPPRWARSVGRPSRGLPRAMPNRPSLGAARACDRCSYRCVVSRHPCRVAPGSGVSGVLAPEMSVHPEKPPMTVLYENVPDLTNPCQPPPKVASTPAQGPRLLPDQASARNEGSSPGNAAIIQEKRSSDTPSSVLGRGRFRAERQEIGTNSKSSTGSTHEKTPRFAGLFL